ncbi:MAG: hypothetical protein ROZ65_12400 [Pseudomonadaceae bacterium]|jgi:hypothetical protein|nr:hypothetical protein [Pseudomonadaceae bacterium]
MSDLLSDKEDAYNVILPCAPNEFADFIAGLLGKPKTLKGVVSGHFSINAKQISNFCHLIQQKVASQNSGTLVNLSISVYYTNGMSVTHHNPADFENFHPTHIAIPDTVVIALTYLIQFNGRNTPEKQEIEITISADRDDTREDRAHWSHSGLCKYVINHTDTSWATDVSNLIKSHAETVIERPTRFREYLTTRFGEMLGLGNSIIFISMMIFWASIANEKIPKLDGVDLKILFVVNSIVALVIAYSICRGVLYWIDMNLALYGHSYICLTQKDFELKAKEESRTGRRWACYLGGWVVNISCGIVSSLIFKFL